MDRRYQVFVSSTFEDLREERGAVISALLQLDCFPAGMELFPAADDDSLTLIKSVIDDSDYYLVLLAGKYGSQPPGEAKSFTHLEYEYALATGKPTIALLHSNPGLLPADRTERSDDGRRLLDGFREELRKKNCRLWKDQAELTSAVFTGVQHLKKTRASVGWIRGSEMGGEGLKDELLRLRREIDALSGELAVARSRSAPEGLEDFAQGADTTNVTIEFESGSEVVSQDVRWDSLMRAVLPQTFGGGAPPEAIAAAISSLVQRMPGSGAEHGGWRRSVVSRSDYGKILNQMVPLGLVEGRTDPTNPLATRWVATPYGVQTGSRLVAVKRQQPG